MRTSFDDVLARDGKLIYTGVGNSMLPMLRPSRDLVIIHPRKEPLKRYDVALYRRKTGSVVLHRVLKAKQGEYVLCGDHQWRREKGVTDAQIIGVLTAFVRNGREISVTNRRYRLYAHLWCDLFWLRAAFLWCLVLLGRIRRKFQKRRSVTA